VPIPPSLPLSRPDEDLQPIANSINDFNDISSLRTKARTILRSYALRKVHQTPFVPRGSKLVCNCRSFLGAPSCIRVSTELPFEYVNDVELLDFLELEYDPHSGVHPPLSYESTIQVLLQVLQKYAEIVF